MKDWMTIKDLSHYLQISENKIRYFIKHKQIPFHDKHGILRFSGEEIDEWMKTPSTEKIGEVEDKKSPYIYRDKLIKEYSLAASKILIGSKPWNRLPGFIKNFIDRINDIKVHDNGRDFLYRKEFSIFSSNYSDYLNVCCQIGLIEKRRGAGKEKKYYPTIYAEKMANEESNEQIKKIILDSILNIVNSKLETFPDERHSILLLWYILAIKDRGLQPKENHFRKDAGELSYYPSIRFNFSKSLCEFLFDNDRYKEQQFLNEWNRLIENSKRTSKRKEVKDSLALFDE
jgi:excisionase family DNA binding protein